MLLAITDDEAFGAMLQSHGRSYKTEIVVTPWDNARGFLEHHFNFFLDMPRVIENKHVTVLKSIDLVGRRVQIAGDHEPHKMGYVAHLAHVSHIRKPASVKEYFYPFAGRLEDRRRVIPSQHWGSAR